MTVTETDKKKYDKSIPKTLSAEQLDYLLSLAYLEKGEDHITLPDGNTFHRELVIGGQTRIDANNITYSRPVQIATQTLAELGINDGTAYMGMDDQGNLIEHNHNKNRHELLLNNDENNVYLQTVTVNGMAQGYFLYKADGYGLYLGPDAINASKLGDQMKADLKTPESDADYTNMPRPNFYNHQKLETDITERIRKEIPEAEEHDRSSSSAPSLPNMSP